MPGTQAGFNILKKPVVKGRYLVGKVMVWQVDIQTMIDTVNTVSNSCLENAINSW